MIPQVNSLPKNNKSRPATALVRDGTDEHRVLALADSLIFLCIYVNIANK